MTDSTLKSSTMLRMIIIAALTLVLLVPTVFIELLVSDRSERRIEAVKEVSSSWGGSQVITGPILTLPYMEYVSANNNEKYQAVHYVHFLPSVLKIQTTVVPEIRHRGIYKVALYNAAISCEGEFGQFDLSKMNIPPENVVWNEAFITIGISDLKGIKDSVKFALNQTEYPLEPGVSPSDGIETGITYKVKVEQANTSHNFSLHLSLNGSSEIQFTPIGEITTVTMDSPWSDPSFVGSFLPETRFIGSNNFRSQWKVSNLNRNYPQAWIDSKYKLKESSFGMEFFLPIDEYQKTSRTIKYAILFIALTFVSFFLSEVITKNIIHPIQYALIGFGLIVFYVLLLSLSEHIPFNIAYSVAGISVVGLITMYTRWITSNTRITVIICSILVLLYSFLFITLQLQDYALLMGSVGLFLSLLLIMYLTRNIDWFSLGKTASPEPKRGL